MFTRVTSNASNPMSRTDALQAAEMISDHGWRVWVEHRERSSERIFESRAEKDHKAAA